MFDLSILFLKNIAEWQINIGREYSRQRRAQRKLAGK